MAEMLPPSLDAEQLVAQAHAHYTQGMAATSLARANMEDDQRFAQGQQWPPQLLTQRDQEGRPCLTINRLATFQREIANEQFSAPPAMAVKPRHDATQETALMLGDWLRQVEQESHADIAYQTAYDACVQAGVGYWLVTTEYDQPTSFRQVPRIRPIFDPLSVLLDPASEDPTGADAEWGMVVQRHDKTAFCAKYGIERLDAESWTHLGSAWATEAEVLVAQYYWRRWQVVTLGALATGEVVALETPVPGVRQQVPGEPIVTTRQTTVCQVWWAQIGGHRLLDSQPWLSTRIPIIRLVGERRQTDDGRPEYVGMTRDARDPSRMYNYFASTEAETIALAPKTPILATPQQVQGFEGIWSTLNTASHAYLPWNPHVVSGTLIPPPVPLVREPAVQAITQARFIAADDLKATIGMIDPTQVQPGPEVSGQALRRRQMQAGRSTAHFAGHLRWSLRATGQVLLELLRALVHGPDTLQTTSRDGQMQTVPVNQPYQTPSGQQRQHQLGQGTYDVVVEAGASYATQREETADKLSSLASAFPPLMSLAGDYVVGALDVQHSQEIAARLRTQVPPEALQATQGDRPEEVLAQVQNQLAQTSQQAQALNAYAQQCEAKNQELTQQVALMERALGDLKVQLDAKTEEQRLKALDLELTAQKNAWDHEETLLELQYKYSASPNGTEE